MAVIELRRMTGARRKPGKKSDFRVYITSRSEDAYKVLNLGVRLSDAVVKRLRWLRGDCVTVDYDDTSSTWTMRRVADDSGNALSKQGKEGGDLTVRFKIEPTHVFQFGLEPGKGCDCDLITVSDNAVMFRRS